MCEALVNGTPVIASHISGLIGTLGDGYPGYFPAEDTHALAEQLRRAETDRAFYNDLSARCREAAHLLEPQHEVDAWRNLFEEA